MGIFEGKKAQRQAEEELAHRWTKFRTGDTLRVIMGSVMCGSLVTVKFPYYFHIGYEQSYIVNETPYAFRESELEFVKQKLR